MQIYAHPDLNLFLTPVMRIRIRNYLALLDPDPFGNTYPDPGARKRKHDFQPFKMAFVPLQTCFDIPPYYLHKVYFSSQIPFFVTAKSDKNSDPHWFGSQDQDKNRANADPQHCFNSCKLSNFYEFKSHLYEGRDVWPACRAVRLGGRASAAPTPTH
jgi:hypothetical protein